MEDDHNDHNDHNEDDSSMMDDLSMVDMIDGEDESGLGMISDGLSLLSILEDAIE